MLPKSRRLVKNRVLHILKKGSKFSNEFLTVRYLLSNLNFNRYSVIISKKVLPQATDRNRIRRQVYNACNDQNSIPQKHLDLVLTVKPHLCALPHAELKQLLVTTIASINAK